ncbi:TetR family transcriptional regulator [Aliidongia dinghuensis]|uniref:TetR family transcriptional regulator n=1 Tax=Aliidongia dinghuensis TaxID=1867774 RepID=A0A8J3E3G2_9PROT|nr:TetR/AcrR family transcriptional regulator [Aliidongia dinghuensis]GGF30077.1 TetR family transcriptional regulator [Aliidongia dinghuensis]
MEIDVATPDTREEIMGLAKRTVQARGYNALSFRELAKEIGVTSASIHYHFPTKGDLAAALARRYTEDGARYLEELLGSGADDAACMRQYAEIFRAALLNGNRMCLCGIMAAERDDLPDAVRVEVDRFIDMNVTWLTKVLSRAETAAPIAERRGRALAVFAAIEGAQLMARGRGDVAAFDDAIAAYRHAGLVP